MLSKFFKNHAKVKSVMLLTIFLVIIILAGFAFNTYSDKDRLQEIISNSGAVGVVIYILIQVTYVTLTPLLNTGILITSGLLFGGHLGFLINFIATSIGLLLIILLVKRFGRPLLERLVSPNYLNKFDYLTEKIGPLTLLIVYILPFTPDDELTYLVAAGQNKARRFILPILIGTLAKSAYSYIGDLGAPGLSIALYARVAGLIAGLLIVGTQEYFYNKSLKHS